MRGGDGETCPHAETYETSDGPDHTGRLVIITRCWTCGQLLDECVDSIL